jgi:hypothetical protein
MNGIDFKGLETRGFVLIPSFLSEAEVNQCREDFSQQPVAGTRRYAISPASQKANERVKERVQEVLALVTSKTNLRPNHPTGAVYFATGRGIQFAWHQDHESFFTVQNHYDYLNFYIPILKPRRDKSNLSIIPFDVLEQESPDTFRKVVRGGASRFPLIDNKTKVILDDTASVHFMGSDISRLAHTPMLDGGDLLLLRGDVIHRTQDTETERVALSFRAENAETLVRRSRLVRGSMHKARVMVSNAAEYERMFRAFDKARKNAVGRLELLGIMAKIAVPKPKGRREFFRYLLWQRMREYLPFSPF